MQALISHWRVPALAAGLLLAFAVGRFTVPTKVMTKTADRVVTVDRVVEKRVEVQAQTKTQIVYRDHTVIQKPDGTVIHRDVERTADEQRNTSSQATEETKQETKVTEHTERKTLERDTPTWHVNALVGLDLHLTPSYGAQVERRILGPIWVGAWGLSSGVGGLSLGVQF